MGKKKTKNQSNTKMQLEYIVLIGKFSDGKCRQIIVNKKTQEIITTAIMASEGSITVLEEPLQSIDVVAEDKKILQHLPFLTIGF
jgi:ABC-type Mn2+/Zn2+ transport system ATPase subunit